MTHRTPHRPRAWAASFAPTLTLALTLALGAGLSGCASGPGAGGNATSATQNTHTSTTQPDVVSPNAPYRESLLNTVRLLEQSSFGPTPEQVERVRRQGFDAYLAEQLRLNTSRLPELTPVPINAGLYCRDAEGADDMKQNLARQLCRRDHYGVYQLQRQFFRNALEQPDQLRQRLAFAWSQVFVVSSVQVRPTYALVSYQQMLHEHALGNFRTLLGEVARHPTMGAYLNLANNKRANAQRQTRPNENFARELLQLFTIGLVKLNPDGSAQRDAQGQPIPTYGQAEISELARVFTGWGYPKAPEDSELREGQPYFNGRLVPVPRQHDAGPKTLLNGQRLAGNPDPQVEMDQALDLIFAHPNVGPFIGRRLIQHLVTGDPSPAYVDRITQVFNNNGQGVRGDLAAVVRAILLDPEARGDQPASPRVAKLREPVLYVARVYRALGVRSDGIEPAQAAAGMGQPLLSASSVFNYYPPDHTLADSGLNAPEMGLRDTASSLRHVEFAWRLLFTDTFAPAANVPDATGTQLDLSPWLPLAAQPEALVDRVNQQLLYGRLQANERAALLKLLQNLPAADARQRARNALFAVTAGPQFQVQH